MFHTEIIAKLLALGLSPLPVAPFQSEPIGKKTGKPIFTGKNPSYLTGGLIKSEIVNHAHFQKTLPSPQELEIWFKFSETGIGCLGSDRYRWLDLDRKHFATQEDCDQGLLAICPCAYEGWLERTQSGGYRLLVDCGESGADFTNFAITEGGEHVGELLGAGRFAVLAPTIGTNGAYENLNYGLPIPLAELNIFPAITKKATPVALPLPIPIRTESIPLEIVLSKAHRDSLNGVYEGGRDNEGAALIRDLIGCNLWLLSKGYSVDGDPYTLLKHYCSRCVPPLDDGDCERIYNSGLKDNPSPCLSEDKLQNCVDAYLLRNRATQDLRYKAPVKSEDLGNINLLDLLPKKYIDFILYGCEKPSVILPTIKGLAIATEQYLISKSIKYRSNPQDIFNQFCKNQEPPLQAVFDSIPSDCEEIDIPSIKKVLAAYDLSQKKIQERIEREALKAAREAEKAKLKADELCELAQNIKVIKQFYSDRFKLNSLTKEIELDGSIFDIDTARIYFGEELNISISKNDAIDVIGVIAESNKYHPVYDYLEDCHARIGDDRSILDGLAAKCFGVENPLYEAFLKKTLIAAVARIYYPLTKFEKLIPKVAKVDHVFCLVSTQGAKKSTFFEALTGEAFFTDNLDKDLSHKDNIMRLHRKWICEIGEIDRVTNSRYEGDLKNFITIKTDIQRFAYLRAQKVCPRQFLFVGTSNRDDFLTDPTGDRRYWIVRTKKKINAEYVEQNRDAIWAAAVSLYKSGAEWWLTEMEQEASNYNNRRYQSDSAWMPTIVDYCEGKDVVSVTELLYRIEPQKSKHTQMMQREIINCLTRLGYAKNGERHRILIDGSNLRVYSWAISHDANNRCNADSEPMSNISQNIENPNSNQDSKLYPVSDTVPSGLSTTNNTHNSSDHTYIHNDHDHNTCIAIPTESNKAVCPTQLPPNGSNVDTASNVTVVNGAGLAQIKIRPVTIGDLASSNPVLIFNTVDNTSGVLRSLGRDGVHYGDFVAPPQNVGVRIE
jgi:predicted P-loop ATPase